MFNKKHCDFVINKLGLPSNYEITYTAISGDIYPEMEVLTEQIENDGEDDTCSLDGYEISEAIERHRKNLILPDNHFIVGIGEPSSKERAFYVVDFSDFKEEE